MHGGGIHKVKHWLLIWLDISSTNGEPCWEFWDRHNVTNVTADKGESSSTKDMKRFWRINLPSKFKLKVFHDCLLDVINLRKRQCLVDLKCVVLFRIVFVTYYEPLVV